MPWAKFDDRFNTHPKVLVAGPLAIALHMRAIIYSSQHMTDGAVGRRQLNHIIQWADDGEDFGGHWPNNSELAERLVAAGLWEATDDGWQIHDYTDWNPSKASALGAAAVRREAARKAGRASGEARRNRARDRRDAERTANGNQVRSSSVRPPFVLRSASVHDPFAETAAQVIDPEAELSRTDRSESFGQRSANVRNRSQSSAPEPESFGDRSAFVHDPFAETAAQVIDPEAELSRTDRSASVHESLNGTRTDLNAEPEPEPVPVPMIRTPPARSNDGPRQHHSALRPYGEMKLPLLDGEFAVTTNDVAEWVDAYPGLDVPQELRSMRVWCLANPKRRKTAKGVRRFIAGWLRRAQDDAGSGNRGGQFADTVNDMMRWAHEQDAADRVRRVDGET